MDKYDILKKVDHTLLKQTATWEDIKLTCEQAIKYNAASVCIPPCFVKRVKEFFNDKIRICTVIGFPNGYSLSEVKLLETKLAIADGADEIDMVINITDVKSENFLKIKDEIMLLKSACSDKILKVIVETCMLNEDEKIMLCKTVSDSGADYIKTSTGFGGDGAKLSDIMLFKKYISSEIKIKAAGGISDFEAAQKFIDAGADRLGTSRLISIMENACNNGN